jgi:thiol-disulfide isomerase/thioredoxin
LRNLQTWNRRGWMLGIFLMILVLGACSNVNEESTNLQSVSINRSAVVDFKLQGLNEDTIDSSTVSKPMFLNFWATWCSYCKQEMPYIDQLAQEYEGSVEFAAINLTHLDSVQSVESYVNEHQYQIPVYLDQKGEVTESFQVLSTPTVILLDHKGNIAFKQVGTVGESGAEAYRDLLNELIEEMNAEGG